VSDHVAGEGDMLLGPQPRRQQVAQRVVLLVEREDGRVGDA
jgi:hypothetical protein